MSNPLIRQLRLNGYGLQYGDASSDISDYMDQSVSDLKWAYLTGGAKIALNPDNLANYLTWGYAIDNSALSAVEANYAKIGTYITQLDNDLRQAVLTGVNASGNPYTLNQWQSFAEDVASDITSQTQFAWDSSYIARAPQSAIDAWNATEHQIAHPTAWPWWVWIPIGASALYLLKPVFEIVNGVIKPPSAS